MIVPSAPRNARPLTRSQLTARISLVCLLLTAGCRTSPLTAPPSQGNLVTIHGHKGQWELLLNGRPFELRGVGVGYAHGQNGANYLAMAREMGANTVRTWGTRQGTEAYLNLAHQLGLYVNAGIWLNPVYDDGTCSYLTDTAYQRRVREETIRYVTAYRRHPAILFWNIGNETISWTKREEERVGFCRFLETLIQDVHAIDPNHPVIYTSAFTTDIEYVKRYVPSLDAIGLNIYGGLEEAHQTVITELNIPYVISEFGPLGPWDRPKDMNGKAIDTTDIEKAGFYEDYAKLIKNYRGYCLGGFAFTLGETSQISLTWWNLNYLAHPRLSLLTLEQLYQGTPIQNTPPFINEIELSKQQHLRPGETFEIHVRYREPEGEPVTLHYFASTDRDAPILEESPNQEVPFNVEGNGTTVTAHAPMQPGIYRIYVVGLDPHNLAGTLSSTLSVD